MILEENERIDDLNINNLKIIQNKKYFCFGIDSVLLTDFVEVKHKDIVLDLGTGTGVIPLLICAKYNPQKIIGIEIQKYFVEIAKRSVKLNRLDGKIEIQNQNIKNLIINSHIDVIVTNPPYFKHGKMAKEDFKAIARHENSCTIEDILNKSSQILKTKGKFFMVHRSERLTEIILLCKKYNLEPKNIKFIHDNIDKKSQLFLIKCVKGAKEGIIIDKPLILRGEENDRY